MAEGSYFINPADLPLKRKTGVFEQDIYSCENASSADIRWTYFLPEALSLSLSLSCSLSVYLSCISFDFSVVFEISLTSCEPPDQAIEHFYILPDLKLSTAISTRH